MKKIFMLAMLFAFSASLFAQSLDDVNKNLLLGKTQEAKTGIDKVLADPKNANKADAWYYKGRVYNALSYDSTLPKSQTFALKSTAFDAFQKYQSLDSKDERLKDEDYKSYLDLYYGTYDLGAKFFGNKDFDASFNSFKKALEIREYMTAKNITFKDAPMSAFDTSLVLNTAIAGTQAKKEAEAVSYYKKLTDANIAGPGYLEVYQYLADYYIKAKDDANLKAIVDKGRKFYPEQEVWDEVELNQVPKNNDDKTALYAKYEELLAKSPNNYTLSYNYAVEYYNSLYGNDAKPKDIPGAKEKLTSILKQAIKNDKGIDATVLMTNHLYNVAADVSAAAQAVKGTKPEDVKKKADLKKQANAKMDEVIPYAENALTYFSANQASLKTMQKANQKIILGYLSEIYSVKGNAAKAAEYEKLKTSLPN